MSQNKQYRAGQMRPAEQGGKTVKSGTRQGTPASKQDGKTHTTKNRSVNHGRQR